MSFDCFPTKLGALIEFSNGKASPERLENGLWPVYGSNGSIGAANETNSAEETIVVGRVGSYCGSVYFSPTRCWVTDNAIRGTAKGENSATFLYYLLKHLNLNNWRSGSGQPLLNQSTLNSIDVRVPQPSLQKEIGKILSDIDKRIALLRETNSTLESIAQALFKSWFVDFDPVHANAGTQALSLPPEIQSLFPSTFVESPLGLVPEGWGVDQCQNLIDVRDGTHASPKESETGFPLITSKHITSGKIRFDDAYLISEVDYVDISRRSAVHHLDVLITMIGTVGIPVFVLNEVTEFAIKNIGLFKTSKRPEFSCFIYLLLKSKDMQNLLESRLAGTTQKYLSLKALREIPLIVPSADVLGKFEEVASSIFKSVHTNNMQVESLISLRDTLLPRLISGQLRLPEVEEMLQ
ncbi:MAG: restriction endonuclease subunit S [Cellvibrio sp.]|uniref:restriction endonuclease subunit S n=1 Tax=Cellvibrio sp. TaxID=1965322 RepID=UPI0027291FEC|nr:restriction endonuclease subunit S [Cellvibrio sp.]